MAILRGFRLLSWLACSLRPSSHFCVRAREAAACPVGMGSGALLPSADVAAAALQSGHGGGALRVIGQVLRSTAALKKRGWKLRDGVAFTKELVERGRKATGADAKTLEGLEEAAKALEAVMATVRPLLFVVCAYRFISQ